MDADRNTAEGGEPLSDKGKAASGHHAGWYAVETLLSGIIAWSLIGWGLKWLTGWVGFLPIGVLVGAACGVYLVIKRADAEDPTADFMLRNTKAHHDADAAAYRARGMSGGPPGVGGSGA
jgi:hypothetical protein